MAILVPNFELAETIGQRIEIDAATVDDLLKEGIHRFGEPFRETVKTAIISVNGKPVRLLKGLKTPLSKDDAVWMLKPSGGG